MFPGGIRGMGGIGCSMGMQGMGMQGMGMGMQGMGMQGGMQGMQGRPPMSPEQMLQQQIQQGSQNGSLSKSEIKKLQARLAKLNKMKASSAKDGQVTMKEQMNMRKYMDQTMGLLNKYRSN